MIILVLTWPTYSSTFKSLRVELNQREVTLQKQFIDMNQKIY